MNNDINKMNETELKDYLSKFADTVKKYDQLRDDELQFLEDHPNRDMWSDEEHNEYGQLLNDISECWNTVRVYFDEIKTISK